ncbi:GNAT family N-acetyltransferase [Paenibacillus whitsoniae]|uniref:GNAT family N-acetyltransferase n=1 Tax=Paenibacillus whitsoniae TaxID=2496558 RepID=A0A430J8A2_9BACL|nr:GNAT family N-acetyltransferase [Paenibacillus whitsoniae]RTE05756.1 GNAT family N-acetyltransferase [Paenibacillus whitsoniae]
MELKLFFVPDTDPDLHALIAKLDDDLMQRYPKEDIFTVDFHAPYVKTMKFAVGYIDDRAVACGALRPLDEESTELKRFFVDPAYRKQGIASRLLAFLEGEALRQGKRWIRLEAGAPQPEALALYMKHGYSSIPRFGEYVACASSLCFEKAIGGAESVV